MRNLFTKDMREPLALSAGQVLSLHAEWAGTLQVTCGRVWVTISGQSDDYWLNPGDHLNVAAGSRMVLEADQGRSLINLRPQVPAVSRFVKSDRAALFTQLAS